MQKLNEDQICRLLQRFEVASTSRLNREQLQSVFDQLVDGSYDNDTLDQICENCSSFSQTDNTYQILDIVRTFIRAEQILLKKLNLMDDQIAQYHEQLQVCKERRNESALNRQTNIFGLEIDSSLEVRLIQARGVEVEIIKRSNKKWTHPELGQPGIQYDPKSNLMIFAALISKKKQYLSNQAFFDKHQGGFVWSDGQSFLFDVEHGKEEITVDIGFIDQNQSNVTLLVGQSHILSELYMHQVPKQEWLKIYDDLGFLVNGEMETYIHLIHDRVSTQFVQNQVKYYDETSHKIESYLDGLDEQKRDLLHDLSIVLLPFEKQQQETQYKSYLEQSRKEEEQVNRKITMRAVQKKAHHIDLSEKEVQEKEEFCSLLARPKTEEDIIELLRVVLGLIGLHLIAVAFCCFYRAAFLDVIYLTYLLERIFKNSLTVSEMKKLLIGLLLTLLNDFSWLFFFQSVQYLWNLDEISQSLPIDEGYANFADENDSVAKTSIIFCYVIVTIKIILLYHEILFYRLTTNSKLRVTHTFLGVDFIIGPYYQEVNTVR